MHFFLKSQCLRSHFILARYFFLVHDEPVWIYFFKPPLGHLSHLAHDKERDPLCSKD